MGGRDSGERWSDAGGGWWWNVMTIAREIEVCTVSGDERQDW